LHGFFQPGKESLRKIDVKLVGNQMQQRNWELKK